MKKLSTNPYLPLLALVLMLVGYGCAPAPVESDASTSVPLEDVAAVPEDSGSVPEATNAAYPVPDGDAQQLTEFINELSQTPPKGNTDEEQTNDLALQLEAKLAAADRLAAATNDDVYQMIAARTKLESLRVLRLIGREDAGPKYDALLGELTSSGVDQMKFLADVGAFHSKLDAMSSGVVEPPEVIKALTELLDGNDKTQELLEVAMETAGSFAAQGLNPDASAIADLIAEKFGGSDDPRVTQIVQEVRSQKAIGRIGALMQKLMMGDAEAEAPLIESVTELMQSEIPLPTLMSLINVTTNLEYSGNVDAARSLYGLALERVAALEDESARIQLQEMLDGGLKRVELVGQPFEVTGQSLDGEAFDWEAYRGKVVLVDFWATWCGPCIAEIPNVKANYEKFHDRGFEVVGVNLDDDTEAAKQFLEEQELPWVTVISEDPENVGFKDPNATRYSVSGIPFLVLVDPDGNVSALHVRGEQLAERLEELLPMGDVAEPDVAANGDAEDGDVEDGDVEMGTDVDEAETQEEEAVEMTLDESETLPPEDGSPEEDEGDGDNDDDGQQDLR